MGLWAILASASIQLSGLNSFYLKHLGISLLLCSVAQILSILLLLVVIFIRLELWRRFLPSQLGLSYWVEDILHPRVMLQSFAGLVRATEVISQLAGISIKPLCFSFFFPYSLQNHSESLFTGCGQEGKAEEQFLGKTMLLFQFCHHFCCLYEVRYLAVCCYRKRTMHPVIPALVNLFILSINTYWVLSVWQTVC